jgi:hypothetical protein
MGAWELSGETVPRLVLRRADGWWDVVPVSTAIRAPQVLLWLADGRSEQRRMAVLFVGVDWGERHHDLCLVDQDGGVLATRRITDGLAGRLSRSPWNFGGGQCLIRRHPPWSV